MLKGPVQKLSEELLANEVLLVWFNNVLRGHVKRANSQINCNIVFRFSVAAYVQVSIQHI